jgi:hypothetical protein
MLQDFSPSYQRHRAFIVPAGKRDCEAILLDSTTACWVLTPIAGNASLREINQGSGKKIVP